MYCIIVRSENEEDFSRQLLAAATALTALAACERRAV